ncbi:low molecular weight protein-tyrosine-phosphatase [Enemella sp. A6]|uniref:low molecular weight protein-tyrosine-phosphatase n=1 Tax=Enemella sp. A6 TaxID=3440152 RepID=UPI003EB88633
MTAPLEVVFVCLGNICRSPMAERIAEHHGGDRPVHWSSVGTSRENQGLDMDSRAARRLERSGYRGTDHEARQVTRSDLDADLLIAMEERHLAHLRRMGADEAKLALLTDFDPGAEPGSGVPDPWYGDEDGFDDTLASLEAAMPGIMARVDELLGQRASAVDDDDAARH